LGLLAAIPLTFSLPTAANAVALPACVDSGYTKASTNITITPSHGKVMYIDTGVSPRIDAAYVGYRITNNTGSALSGYWVSLTNFRGNVVSLANSADANQQLIDNSSPLPDVANGATRTVYFLVKANTSTKSLQTHTVSIYAGRPDAVSAAALSQCDFAFTKVAETIKAAANKVTAVTVDASTPSIGSLVTVTVTGAAGVIGAGSADVGKILWFSPAAFSTFPTTSLRLESVKLKIANNNQIAANGNNKVWIYDERLLVTPSITPSSDTSFTGEETTADALDSKRFYENVYKFRVISRAATSTTINPIAQISSGTQIKHTDVNGSSSGTINTTAAPITLSVSKSATIPNPVVTETISDIVYSRINYTVTVTNSSGTGRVDQIVDTPGSGVLFKTGSAKIGSTVIPDPVKLSTESSMNPQPLHFIGPFTVANGSPLSLTYTMLVPQTNSTTFTNTAVAYTGSQIIGASSSAISGATVTNNGSGVPTTTVTTTTTLNPVAVTFSATAIGTTTAVLNGTVDGNGQTPTYQFEWATNSSLAGYTTITPSSNTVSGSDPTAFTSNFTGTSGTTYWYRIVAVKSGVRYPGEIVSFTLIEPASPANATTVNASAIQTTSATLNGTIDPNLQSITEVRFLYGTNSNLSGGTSRILYELDEDGKETNVKVALSGANPIDVAWTQTGLTNNTTYFFRIEATYTSGSVQNVTGSILSFRTGTTAQTITFNALTNQNYIANGTYTVAATASSNLAVTYTSETTSVCTVNASTGVVTFVTAGTCVITASQAGNTTFAPAASVSQQFEINPAAPTVQTNSASNITKTAATLNGAVTTGGSTDTAATFTYSTNSNLSSGNTTVTAIQSPLASDNNSVNFPLTGLTAGTTYYYRISATNSNSTVNGSIVSFVTASPVAITLTADNKSKNYLATDPSFTFQQTSGTLIGHQISGVTYTFQSTGSTPSYGPSTTIPTQVGTYSITPAAAVFSIGDVADYAITYVAGTYTIDKIAQAALTFANRNLSRSTPYTLSTTGGSGTGAVSYTYSSGTVVCSISSAQITTPGSDGTCVIEAVKAADRNYLLETATATMTINSMLAQTISFAAPSNRNYSPTSFTETATATSDLTVTLTSNTPSICTVAANTLSITMLTAGVCTLTASQAGNGSYNPADPVTQSFTISKETRTIEMKSSTDAGFSQSYVTDGYANWGLTPPTLKSLASEGDNDAKTYSLDPSSVGCEVDANGTTRFVGAGTCKVKVSITGDKYINAESTVVSFDIGKKNQTIAFTALNPMTIGDANQDLVSSTDGTGLTVTLSIDASSVGICEIVSGRIRALTAGTCVVNSNQSGNSNFNPAAQVQQTFVISAAPSSTPAPTPTQTPSPVVLQKITPAIVWKNPLPIRYKTLLSATQLNAIATLPTSVTAAILDPKSADQLSATAPRLIGTYSYLPMSGQMLSVGVQKLNVTFTPLESGTYEAVSATVEILVRDVPTLTWANPAPIKKGTPLGNTQLNAVGSVPGAYKYLTPAGTILAPGKHKLKVLFTPTDPSFEPIEAEVEITVESIIIDPQATPIVTPSDTKASQPITNTTSSVILSVLAVGSGLTTATTNGSSVSVEPKLGFSGKTQVLVKVLDQGEEKQIVVPVTVLPLPAVALTTTPNNRGQSTISWKASPNAISYEVTLGGRSICSTSATSCATPALIGPKSDVKVLAKGNDETVAPVISARYTAPRKPITALVVYFDTNKFNLDAKDKADIQAIAKVIIEQGFKNIVVNGHTDLRGGVDNKVLSRNRSNSTFNYLKQLVPGLKVTIGAFASTKPAVRGKSAAALASNRRAEVGVY